MRVALYGGSFNPPHVAHQLVALYVLETQDIDELWFVPCFKHPFDKELAPFEDRLAMCHLAANALGARVRVSDCEGRLGGESLTLRTVTALRTEHPDFEFALVIGADLEPQVSSWYGADQLRRLIRFIIVGRAGFATGTGPEMPAVSSRDVRDKLRAGTPVEALVPRSVLDYLRQRKLYGSVEPSSK